MSAVKKLFVVFYFDNFYVYIVIQNFILLKYMYSQICFCGLKPVECP